jgi:hypothetical protein
MDSTFLLLIILQLIGASGYSTDSISGIFLVLTHFSRFYMLISWWFSNQRDYCSQETPGTDSRLSSKSPPKNGLAAAATDSAGCHRDCILSLASAQTNQRLLISSSRDGAIKVWK